MSTKYVQYLDRNNGTSDAHPNAKCKGVGAWVMVEVLWRDNQPARKGNTFNQSRSTGVLFTLFVLCHSESRRTGISYGISCWFPSDSGPHRTLGRSFLFKPASYRASTSRLGNQFNLFVLLEVFHFLYRYTQEDARKYSRNSPLFITTPAGRRKTSE